MKEVIAELALAVGGSHYPTVGGDLLQKFADALVKECIKIVEETPKHCAITTYDLGTVECTIAKSVEQLKQHFGI